MNPSSKGDTEVVIPMDVPPGERPLVLRAAALLLELTKARLVSLVVVTAAVGYIMAAPGGWSGARLAWTLAGTALAAAGSMALNQRIEADQDALMERTRHRPLPTGAIGLAWASLFGVTVATAGVVVLAWRTNLLTAALGLSVIGIYTLVYTPMKRRTTACTLAGAICGAIPPMMGWSAATGELGVGAWVLAGILFLWQIPHFLALAWLYRDDYERGGFRMLPIVDPAGDATVLMVVLYSLALLPVGLAATLSGMAGWTYAAGSLALGGALLALGGALARSRSLPAARRVFYATLVYLPLLLGLMVADRA
jgi:protoheme IX farnesyltransferase